MDDWGKIICLGDFNTVRDNKLDIISGTLHAQRTIDAFNEFSELSYLHDIWREQNPNLKASKPNMTSARRLDYILTGSSFTNSNHNLETYFQSVELTDHRSVILNIGDQTNTRSN